MVEINVRNGKPYFSQRNNLVRPYITCNDTSMVAGLSYRGVDFPNGKYDQPEDNLTEFMLTDPRVDAFYKANFPTEYAAYLAANKDPKNSSPPNEIHVVLSYGVNIWLGKQNNEITIYKENVPTQVILFELIRGKPVVESGLWDGMHHITCTAGFATTQDNVAQVQNPQQIDVSQVVYFIIDDPYGDFHSNYQNQNGEDIKITPAEYKTIVTAQNSDLKNGHFFLV